MHLTEPVFFSHPFQSRTALEKGGLQLLGPRLTPGKTQPQKVLSNTDGDELLHCLSLIEMFMGGCGKDGLSSVLSV